MAHSGFNRWLAARVNSHCLVDIRLAAMVDYWCSPSGAFRFAVFEVLGLGLWLVSLETGYGYQVIEA